MFKALQPLLQERSIHILLSANKDGKIGVYVSPVKKDDKEDAAFVTPFRCEGTAEELDNELSGVLTQWLASRTAITTSLSEALAAAEAQTKAAADEAKKKAADKNKKPTPATTSKTATPTKAVPGKAAPATPVTPSLLDAPAAGGEGDEDEEGGENTAPADAPALEVAAASATTVATAEAAVVAAPVAEAPAPVAAAPEAPVVAPAPVEPPPAPVEPPPAPAAVVSSDPVTPELF